MRSSSYKMIVVDIDGTLIGKNGRISDRDKEALARVNSSGVKVVLSTGRATMATRSVINELGLDGYHVFFDGALVSNPHNGEEVYVQPIVPALVRQVVEFARRHELNIGLFSASEYFIERESELARKRHKFFGIRPSISDYDGIWERERIVKGGMATSSPRELEKIRLLGDQFKGSLDVTWARTPAFPDVDFINIVASSVSKGKAVAALADYLGIPLAQVMAIGDGINDISLLTIAGLAVAMDNAPAEVKAVADYVTLHIEQSGVAAALEELL